MSELRRGFAGISELLFLSILVVGLAASTILTQQEQRPQPQAALACRYCSNGYCYNRNPPCDHGLDQCFENADCPAPTPRPPTSTPRPPTSTPAPPNPTPRCGGTCYQGYACPPGYDEGENCPSGYTCCTVIPTLTPTPSPIPPTPTAVPVHCIPGDTKCVDPLPGSNYPTFQTCNPLGNGWNISNCSASQICNWNHTLCVSPINLTPTPECTSGQTMCENQMKYGCVGGEWMPYTNPGNCLTATPTPVPPTPTPISLYNCPASDSMAWCTQNNPLWANISLPNCTDTIIQRGCGHTTVCSLLCSCKKTAQYCNVNQCIAAVQRFQNNYACSTGVDLDQLILKESGCFNTTESIIPDDTSNPDNHVISWDKINQLIDAGFDVQVGGTFNLKPAYGSGSWNHFSLIVGRDAQGRIYHDPYFNSGNPAHPFDKYLENYMNITINEAVAVKK